jgi:glycosyltransferase involved in cell wall biosynthesis
MRNFYFVVHNYTENSGSYAGFVEEFAKFLSGKGFHPIILCKRQDDGPTHEHLPYAEVFRFKVPKARIPLLGMNLEYFFLSRRVKRYFEKHPPGPQDIILANSRAALGVLDRKYVLRVGQPARIFQRNMEIAKDEVSLITRAARSIHFIIQRRMEKKCVQHAKAFIFSSEKSRQYSLSEYGNPRPYLTPHNGVKHASYRGGKRLPLKGRHLLFVSAGSERVRKGVHTLEKALPEIFSAYPDVKLLHVGERFSWLVPEWCKERIVSVGKVPWSMMKDYYVTADVSIFCSLSEWIPNALFEAMAAGAPIVTSDMDGVDEFVTHEVSGLIYRRGSAQGLVRGIRYVLDNGDAARKMGRVAQSKAMEIDSPKYNARLLEFIERSMRT